MGNGGAGNDFTFTQADFDNLEDKLRLLEAKLDSKVDNDVFDNEIAQIRALIGEMDRDDKATDINLQK